MPVLVIISKSAWSALLGAAISMQERFAQVRRAAESALLSSSKEINHTLEASSDTQKWIPCPMLESAKSSQDA
jgi:hypothetical protein